MSESDSSEIEQGIAFKRLCQQVDELEMRLNKLEILQKQDADEAIGVIGEMKENIEELEDTVEKLQDQVEHHKHLFERYRMSDLLK